MLQGKVILVTGSSKGIGYGIVRTLLATAPESSIIYLTSRNETAGLKAVDDLKSSTQKSKLAYHKLNTSNLADIDILVEKIKSEHGHLDVLVNNAGVAYAESEATEMVKVNYYGTLNMCRKFIPVMRPGTGRIVAISSIACTLHGFREDDLKKVISDQKLTVERLNIFIDKYEKDVSDGKSKENGWPGGYCVTKAGVTALTAILAKENPNLLINCCCPGWVETDMGIRFGTELHLMKTLDEGVRIPCRLAVDDINGISGKFWKNFRITDNGYGEPTDWWDESSWSTEDIDFLKAHVP